ncbi:MAG TPA: LytTR family transcriptional regulator DNA-binding domain-containing protein [Paucimonas sp.]|nr:LytTR family transcriptional regulator DNA-binding domain-containing protein [Paucimonas sp.]
MTRALKALIVDDEELARRLVREYLQTHPDIEIAGECENGLEAARDIGALAPDLVFLDIQMPKLTGLEVLELTGRRSGVIFTTAYDEFALKAFDLHAVDYLLKPFSQERFDEALARARKLIGQVQPALDSLIAGAAERIDRILIRDREQVHVVPVERIDYLEAQDDYVAVNTTEGKTYLKRQRLSELEEKLDPRTFVRLHRSYIVNIAQLQAIEQQGKDGHAARLRSGKRIPISRTGYERIKAIM